MEELNSENVQEINSTDEFENIVKQIVLDGGKITKNLKIINCSYNEDYPTVLCISTDKPTMQMVPDRTTGERKEGLSKTFYISLFAIVAILKRMENYKWLGKKINDNPKIAPIFISEAVIDIVQTKEAEGTAYINPFSIKKEPQEPFDSDKIITHAIKISLGKTAKETCKSYMLAALGL